MLSNSLLHTKEKIILATIDVIHEHGFHSLSTREVAERVGISEPAIFKHFKTKSDIILAVLDHFSLYDNDVIQSIRTKNLSPLESLRTFFDVFGSYYDNYPAMTSVTLNLNLLQNDVIYQEKVRSIQHNIYQFITKMLDEAKAFHEIKQEVDTQALSITLVGVIREWCYQWRENQYDFSLNDRVLKTVTMLLDAFSNEEKGRK